MGHVIHPTRNRGCRFSRVRWQQGARPHMPIQVDTKPSPPTPTHHPMAANRDVCRHGLAEPCLRGVRTFSRGGEPMRVQLLAQRMGQVVVSSPSNILIRLRLDRAATRHTEAEQHTRSHDGPEPKTPHRRPLSSRRATARRPGRYACMVPAPRQQAASLVCPTPSSLRARTSSLSDIAAEGGKPGMPYQTLPRICLIILNP